MPFSLPNTITASFTATVLRFLLLPQSSCRLSPLHVSAAVNRPSILVRSGIRRTERWSPIRCVISFSYGNDQMVPGLRFCNFDSYGYWTFFFEVEVVFSGGPFRRSEWVFEQSARDTWELRYALPNGVEFTSKDTKFKADDMAVPVNRYIEANRFLWLDTPGLLSFNGTLTIVEGTFTWSLAFFATNKKTGLTCVNYLTLELTLTRRSGVQPGSPSWRVF